jgi:ribonuclease Z
VLGLPGLIQTLGISDYDKPLKIFGPKGTKERFKNMMSATVFEERVDVQIEEVDGKFYQGSKYSLEAGELDHNVPTIGYRFVENDKRKINLAATKKLGIPDGPLLGQLQEGKSIMWKGKKINPNDATHIIKGKVIAYLPDSLPSKNSLKLADNADLLICESTYSSKLQEKAEEYAHMTSKQAALIANNANAKKLVLTHFSARYKDTYELEEDAKDLFSNVIAAKDFMKINL